MNTSERSWVLALTMGRMVGWVAHAIEQYESGQLLRPRARYTGRAPQRDG